MFDDRGEIGVSAEARLRALLSEGAPASSAGAFASLPALLVDGDDAPEVIHARIDLALLCAAEGLLDSALYQIDELTKDARRVRDTSGDNEVVERADAAREAIEEAA